MPALPVRFWIHWGPLCVFFSSQIVFLLSLASCLLGKIKSFLSLGKYSCHIPGVDFVSREEKGRELKKGMREMWLVLSCLPVKWYPPSYPPLNSRPMNLESNSDFICIFNAGGSWSHWVFWSLLVRNNSASHPRRDPPLSNHKDCSPIGPEDAPKVEIPWTHQLPVTVGLEKQYRSLALHTVIWFYSMAPYKFVQALPEVIPDNRARRKPWILLGVTPKQNK